MKKDFLGRLLAAGVLLSGSVPALAEGIEGLVAKMSGGKATVLKKFDTEVGLQGFVLSFPNNSYSVAFSDSSQKFLAGGFLMGPNGENLAKKYYDAYVPKPDYLSEMKKATSVLVGKTDAPHTFYVVGEPNCGYCKRLYSELEPYVQSGEVAVNWILIGFNEDGAEKAGFVLGSKDRVKALSNVFRGDAGGKSESSAVAKIEANKAITQKLGIQGTPFIVFKALNGNVQSIPGSVGGEKLAALIKVAAH